MNYAHSFAARLTVSAALAVALIHPTMSPAAAQSIGVVSPLTQINQQVVQPIATAPVTTTHAIVLATPPPIAVTTAPMTASPVVTGQLAGTTTSITSTTAATIASTSALAPTSVAVAAPVGATTSTTASTSSTAPVAITSLSTAQLSALSPVQVASIPTNQIATFTVDQVTALQPPQVTALKVDQVSALRPDLVSALSGAQIAALQPAQLTTLRPEQLAAVQPALVAALRPEQLSALKPEQLAGLRPEQAAALLADQVAHLTSAQLAALRPEQIAALRPDIREMILKALGRTVPGTPAVPAVPAAPAVPAIPGGPAIPATSATPAVPASPAVPPVAPPLPKTIVPITPGEATTTEVPLAVGGTVNVAVGARVLQAVQSMQPEVTTARAVIDPAPTAVHPLAQEVLGNGRVEIAQGLAPVDVLLELRDAADSAITPAPAAPAWREHAADGPEAAEAAAPEDGAPEDGAAENGAPDEASEEMVLIRLPLGQPAQPGAEFHWLHEVLDDGEFLGYTWSPDEVVDQESGTVTIPLPVSALQGTLFLPVSIMPGYVANHDPLVHMWSGPTDKAKDFGFAGPQFTTFPVVAPQVGLRLFVFSPVVNNYAWIDVKGVGPVGDPDE